VLQLQRAVGNRATGRLIVSARRSIQRETNKSTNKAYRVQADEHQLQLVEADGTKRGLIDYELANGQLFLKTIDTKSQQGPPGAGALLVYHLAFVALSRRLGTVNVTNATPEQTGFYLHMGFAPDPAFLDALEKSGMARAKIDELKYTTLSATTDTLFDRAGASVVKNWSDPSWRETGPYAGRHPEHGEMYHVPL
jgi:hypothetical protein